MGIRIQPTFEKSLISFDWSKEINYPIQRAHCMLGIPACSEAYEFGWALSCYGWDNILLRRRRSYSRSDKLDLSVVNSSLFSRWPSVHSFYPPPLNPLCQGWVKRVIYDGENIASSSQLPKPPIFFVYYSGKVSESSWKWFIVFFTLAWGFSFWMRRQTQVSGFQFLMSA